MCYNAHIAPFQGYFNVLHKRNTCVTNALTCYIYKINKINACVTGNMLLPSLHTLKQRCDDMTKFDRVIRDLAWKGVPFYVKTDYLNGGRKTLSKITITIKYGTVGQKLYYAEGKLISKRLAAKLGVQV